MRIRQLRPEFFTDPLTAHLSAPVQVTYIGLWCVADDAGYLVWDVPQIGALLYPYKSVPSRERIVRRAGATLEQAGRLCVYECGCARIPTLTEHQKIGGNKSYLVRDKHRVHTSTDVYARNVTLSNGRVGNGTDAPARGDGGASDLGERLVAAGIKPELVS